MSLVSPTRPFPGQTPYDIRTTQTANGLRYRSRCTRCGHESFEFRHAAQAHAAWRAHPCRVTA